MIHLHFAGLSPADSVTLGPAPWFRVSGNFIRRGPDGEIVATYTRHHWEVRSRFFTRFDCADPAVLHFEDAAGGPSQEFGPFGRFYAADGVVHADGKLFAKFAEETQLWHCYPTENFWPALAVRPAKAA